MRIPLVVINNILRDVYEPWWNAKRIRAYRLFNGIRIHIWRECGEHFTLDFTGSEVSRFWEEKGAFGKLLQYKWDNERKEIKEP